MDTKDTTCQDVTKDSKEVLHTKIDNYIDRLNSIQLSIKGGSNLSQTESPIQDLAKLKAYLQGLSNTKSPWITK